MYFELQSGSKAWSRLEVDLPFKLRKDGYKALLADAKMGAGNGPDTRHFLQVGRACRSEPGLRATHRAIRCRWI